MSTETKNVIAQERKFTPKEENELKSFGPICDLGDREIPLSTAELDKISKELDFKDFEEACKNGFDPDVMLSLWNMRYGKNA